MLGSQQSLLSGGGGRDHPVRQPPGQQVHHLRLTQLHEVHHGHQEGNRIDVVKFAFVCIFLRISYLLCKPTFSRSALILYLIVKPSTWRGFDCFGKTALQQFTFILCFLVVLSLSQTISLFIASVNLNFCYIISERSRVVSF